MEEIGLRQLRQDASEIVRRVEAGETLLVTVSGRAAAELRPVERRQWSRWSEVDDLFTGPGDPAWQHDRELVEDAVRDPFATPSQ